MGEGRRMGTLGNFWNSGELVGFSFLCVLCVSAVYYSRAIRLLKPLFWS